jgi:hypothetical protein
MVNGINTITRSNTSPDPFVPEDYEYANTIIDRLKAAGYRPGIKKYKIG